MCHNILFENLLNISWNPTVPFTTKLFFHDISKYVYMHNDYIMQNKDLKLFRRWNLHPLVLWKLNICQNNKEYLFDLITNITTNNEKFNSTTISYTNYVSDPLMVYKNEEFLLNWDKRNDLNLYADARMNILVYKEFFIYKLENEKLIRGIFIQSNVEDKIHIKLYK